MKPEDYLLKWMLQLFPNIPHTQISVSVIEKLLLNDLLDLQETIRILNPLSPMSKEDRIIETALLALSNMPVTNAEMQNIYKSLQYVVNSEPTVNCADIIASPLKTAITKVANLQSRVTFNKCHREEVVPPHFEDAPKQPLTLSEVLSLLALLVTIYSAIVASKPSEQLERLIAQNEAILAQQAEIVELSREDQDLRDTLETLTDSINLLSNEIEQLRNNVTPPNDFADSFHQPNSPEYQQQDCQGCDTQD